MLDKNEFYQTHLDRVSRSFAFCIRQLPDPLRSWVGLSYLLCRILDTVEDSSWRAKQDQARAFALFDSALADAEHAASLRDWAAVFPSEVNAGERALLADAEVIVQDLHELPSGVRTLITELVQSMSAGMQHFAAQNPPGVLRLSSLGEVNQYCFFVAGLVGELLAKLVAKVEPAFAMNQVTMLRAHHFGLFLQKVNLLKDQVADETAGRFLLPSREEVERSAELNVSNAFDFLTSLPAEQIEFRRFCAWSMFLGLEALSVARASSAARAVLKVSREKATEIIAQVEGVLTDEAGLAVLFDQTLSRLGWKKSDGLTQAPAAPLPEWLIRLYRGRLQLSGLTQLGLG
jgi:phytoene/squalene synthetase